MKEKKNIERLFQERFKNFEVQPPENTWSNISKGLHPKKKNKKVIPFWIKLSGIAATLLIGFLILKNNFNSGETQFTTNKNLNPNTENQDIKPTPNPVFENEILTQTETENQDQNSSETDKNLIPQKESQIVSFSDSDKKQKNKTSDKIKKSENTKNQDNQIVYSSVKDNKKDSDKTETEYSSEAKKTDEIVNNQNLLNQNKDDFKNDNSIILIDRNSKIQQELNENLVLDTEVKPNEKKSLQEFLEELNSDKDNSTEEQVVFNRWKITPNIAPVMMNSTSEGSPISEQFTGNSKDFQTSVSYGLGISYALSEKLNIRTGINKFSLGYNTNDILVYASADRMDVLSNQMNINFSDKSNNIVIKPEQGTTFNNESFGYKEGYLDQRMGYLEVPVELSYKLLDKRFGIELIGGMSTLFLQENEISVVSDGMRTNIGKANNLNDVHFSTNLGIGFRYEIFKSFEASIEPMFKYQLGTYSKNDGNFKPYILGLYSGLSFKF